MNLVTAPTNLADKLTKKDLGQINDNKLETIQAKVIELNPELTVKDFDVTNITQKDGTAECIGKGDYAGTVSVNFSWTPETKSLSEILKKTVLGNLPNNGTDTIGAKAIELNDGLTADMFDITGTPTDTTAIATGKGEYKDAVNLTFTLNPISGVIVNTELDIIMFDDNSKILGSMVAQKVIEKNDKATINDFNIKDEDVKYDLNANTGTATAYGVYKYGDKVALTFKLNPEDAHRPTSKKLKKTK